MGRKRVEETDMGNVVIDTTPVEEMGTLTPKRVQLEEPDSASFKSSDNEPVNCLRNERIIVRYIKKPSTLVSSDNHVLSGGMAETATRRFAVPRLNSTGLFVNVLTNNEMAFLERAMGLEKGTMSIYRKHNNFWSDANSDGIGKVTLYKQDNYLDLSIPEDYIKYKILLANKDYIARSMEELENRPKETYMYVIISENSESQRSLSRMDAQMECYTEYGAIRRDKDTLRVVIELLERRPTSPNIGLEFLQGKVNDYIQSDPRRFLTIVKDELLPTKVLIKKCVENGLIGMKNNTYYLREDGSPLCEIGEDSTLNNAAKYISSIKHQELKYKLEAKLKE